MTARAVVAAVALLELTACGSAVEPPASLRTRAEAFAAAEMAPLDLAPVASWMASGIADGDIVCGEIEAPASLRKLRSTLRYVYFGDGKGSGQIEMHEAVVGTDDATARLIGENRVIFDRLWADHCGPYAPFGRRLTGWFGGNEGTEGDGTTPLTNAAVDKLLRDAKR